MTQHEKIRQVATEVTKRLTDEGKLIEAGFAAFATIMLKDAPVEMLRVCRIVYLAGAEHLFDSIISIMEPDAEPTEKDMERMSIIGNEVEAIRAMLEGMQPGVKGRG